MANPRRSECPVQVPVSSRACGAVSSRVHGRYRRTLQDVPAGGRQVLIALTVRRLVCRNPSCAVRTFAEPVEPLTHRFARRTAMLRQFLERTAPALAGRAASRLLQLAGVRVGRDTLIQMVRDLPDPEVGRVAVLGVDDFAKRRGQSYATVLVDMNTHRPIDVLDDREAATFADWPREHPGATVICRDRAGAYSNGAREGAPDAIQVADRYHLWANLGEYVERTVKAHHRCIQDHYAALKQDALAALPDPQQLAEQTTADRAEARPRVVRTRRLYEQVQQLKAKGLHVAAITRELRIAPATAGRYFHAQSSDELVAAMLAGWPSSLDPFKPHPHSRWNTGCTNIKQLHREIAAQGFRGSYWTVYSYLKRFKGQAAPPATAPPPKVRHVTSWIRRNPDNLTTGEQLQLKEIRAACPHLDILHGHVEEFAKILTRRQGEHLDAWIATVRADDLPHLHTFATGLERDWDAVVNGLTLPYSSGAVEGAVTRIKAIKRSRYGRAKLDLLRKIIICGG